MIDQTISQQYALTDNDFSVFHYQSKPEDIGNLNNSTAFKLSNFNSIKYFNLESKINGFQNLQSNWDSYDADPTADISISKAIETLGWLYKNGFLSSNIEIDVFPMRDGGIQFEFEVMKACSEFEIDKEGICTYIFYNESDGLLDKIQIYKLPELKILLENLPNETKRVSLAGTFSNETTALFKEHLKTIRNEWE